MQEQYSNNTFQNSSDDYYDYNYDYDYDNITDYDFGPVHPVEILIWLYFDFRFNTVYQIVSWIVIIICLPLIILAIYYLYSLVRHDHVAPIYVINLLISDLIQLCCMAILLGNPEVVLFFISNVIHSIGLMASVGFMVCISLERYLLIAWPLWYRFRRTVKVSVVVCIVVWVLALVVICSAIFSGSGYKPITVFLLLPFPVLIFSVVGIFKGLSAAISVSSEEKRRIVGATILVLLNYTLLFLPFIIWTITLDHTMTHPYAFIFFNPLGDLILYIFMRKGAIDKILASVCCCRMETQQQQIIAVNDNNMTTVSSV